MAISSYSGHSNHLINEINQFVCQEGPFKDELHKEVPSLERPFQK